MGLVTIFLSYKLNIWVDEAYTLNTTGSGLLHALRQAIYFELQSPGYFVLLGIWRLPGESYLWARLFSVLCLLLTLPLLVSLARTYLPTVNPLWVVLPLAMHNISIYAALELRCYALVLLLSALLMWLFHQGYRGDEPLRWARLLYLVTAVVAVYCQYYLGFMLVAHGAVLVAERSWRSTISYLIGMAGVALALVPLAWVVPAQVGGYAFTYEVPGWPLALKSLYWRVGDYLFPLGFEALRPVRAWGLRLLTLILLAMAFVARRQLRSQRVLPLLISVGVLILLTLPMLKAWGHEMVGARHTVYLLFPLLLLALVLADVALGKRAVAAVSLVIILASFTSLYSRYGALAKEGDWIRVARHIEQSESPRQPVVVFRPQSALALQVHYKGKNKLVPIPGPTSFTTWEPAAEALKDEQQIAGALGLAASGGTNEFWLVTDTGYSYMSINYNHALLERYVKRHFTVQGGARSFFGSSVRLLRRRPGGGG